MSDGGGRWIDRIVGWCFGAFTASILLYCTVQLLQSVLPALIVVGGIVGLLALVTGGIVVFRTWRGHW